MTKQRTDKPKYKGSFVGHVVTGTKLVPKSCSWIDAITGERKYRKIISKVKHVAWTWNGKDWC